MLFYSSRMYASLLVSAVCLWSVVCGQYTFSDENGLGRRFDGIGGLSGGGVCTEFIYDVTQLILKHVIDMPLWYG